VQKELRKALRIWERLKMLKETCVSARKQKQLRSAGVQTGRTWEQAARKEKIPREYWAVVKLPEFSVKSEPRWWGFLWPLIRKNNPGLLEKLRRDAKRGEEVWIFTDGQSRKQVRARKLYWKDFQRQFRLHLKALADLRVP
jgi:hypothetical protein